jgi:hypothetical protein
MKEVKTAFRVILGATALASFITAEAVNFDSSKYFAYLVVPRPSERHAQEYVFLSKERCISKAAPKDAKAAMYYALREQAGCWAERNGQILTCRANAESVGTDCYANPKSQFLDISNLPKAAAF